MEHIALKLSKEWTTIPDLILALNLLKNSRIEEKEKSYIPYQLDLSPILE